MAFQIFTDTSSGMPKKLREQYGIEYFRMGLIIAGEQKHGDLDYEEFSRYMRFAESLSGCRISTAQRRKNIWFSCSAWMQKS